jgi:AraC-like DNA-binding protein
MIEAVLVLTSGVSVVTLIVISTLLFRAFPSASAVRVNAYLGCYYLCVAYVLFVSTLIESDAIFSYPHFYRTGLIFMYAALPFPYFYFRKLLKNESFKRRDLFHFLVPALLILDLLPFFLSSAGYKREVLVQNLAIESDRYFLSAESYFGIGAVHMIARFAMVIFYLSQQAKWLSRIKAGKGVAPLYQRSDWQKWLNFFFISNGSISILPFVFFMIGLEEVMWTSSIIVISVISLLSTFYLLFSPTILHPYLELTAPMKIKYTADEQAAPEVPSKETVNERVLRRVVDEKAFLIPKYTLHQLSVEINLPSTVISQFLQEEFQGTFYDYVNTNRVKYVTAKLAEMQGSDVVFEALAKEAGFSNRTSFSNAFKKVTGMAPSTYLAKIKAPAVD